MISHNLVHALCMNNKATHAQAQACTQYMEEGRSILFVIYSYFVQSILMLKGFVDILDNEKQEWGERGKKVVGWHKKNGTDNYFS